jgi:serine/threonine-protein phosphatase 2A regulatory subunit A
MFHALCQDDTPMVRRAGASKLKDFVAVCKKEHILADVIPIYKALSQEDTQDTIRVACVQTTLVVAELLSEEENRTITMQVIRDAYNDRSWRVRLALAKNFDQLCKAVGPAITNTLTEEGLVTLLKDNEQEVRKEAVKVIESCLKLKDPIDLTVILPLFESLKVDSAQYVRAALAQIIGPVAEAIGREKTTEKLLMIITDLLKDEFQEVRLNVVSHAGLICKVMSVDGMVHGLLHAIQLLVQDNHWRIRKAVVEQVPKLAELFGVEMFQSKLETLYISSLKDSVHDVRASAIKNLRLIATHFKSKWTVDHLVPQIVELYSKSTGYANRVTILQVLPHIQHVLSGEEVASSIIPLVKQAARDPVPNVRFTACRTLLEIAKRATDKVNEHTFNKEIKPALQELVHDQDSDVQYFASLAMQEFEKPST